MTNRGAYPWASSSEHSRSKCHVVGVLEDYWREYAEEDDDPGGREERGRAQEGNSALFQLQIFLQVT